MISAPLQPTSAAVSLVVQSPPPTGSASQPSSAKPTPVPTPTRVSTPLLPLVTPRVVVATAPLNVKDPLPAPTPSSTPKPTPKPPLPARTFVFSYAPPLSVEEAGSLIRAAVDILMINDPATLAARCQKVAEIIDVTSNYLTLLDQRSSRLSSYDWHFVDREKVDGPGIDRDVYRAQPPIAKVSAISFAADFGDVYIYSVEVLNAAGATTTFTLNRLIEENMPHQEICWLFFPKTIQSVTLRYEARGNGKRTPRLAVFAGVAREDEYLKQALWYLRYSHREVETALQAPATAAPHVGEAAQNLRWAATRLIRFRVKKVL